MRLNAFLPGHLCKTVVIEDQMMALQLGRWSEKRWQETCSIFPLICLQENGRKFFFLRRNNFKVIAQRNITKCFFMLKLRYQCLENLFSLKNLLSWKFCQTACPKSMASAATRARNLHQQQILWKSPLQLKFCPMDLVPRPPCFIYCTSDYLKIFWKHWTCGEEKNVIEMSKRKRNPPYLNGRDFFSQLEEREDCQEPQSLSAGLLVRKQMWNDGVNHVGIIWQSKRILDIYAKIDIY